MTAVRLMPVVPALLAALAAVAEPSPFALVPYPRRCVQTRSVYAATTNDVDGLPVVRKTDATLPPEGYRLSVTPQDITVWSSDEAGAFYAVQTLRQLSREKPANAAVRENLVVPCAEIEDAPRFRERGLALDDPDGVLDAATLREQVDLLSRVKMNLLVWRVPAERAADRLAEVRAFAAARHVRVVTGTERAEIPASAVAVRLDVAQDLPDDAALYAGDAGDAVSLADAYRFDPVAGGLAGACRVGVEIGRCDLAWRLWPRLFALAEASWSDASRMDYGDFLSRVAVLRRRLVREHVAVAPLPPARELGRLTGDNGRVARFADLQKAGGASPESLRSFLDKGGTLVVTSEDVRAGRVPVDLARVTFDGTIRPLAGAVMAEDNLRAFSLPKDARKMCVGVSTGAWPLLRDAERKTLVWKYTNDTGGNIYTIASPMPQPFDDYLFGRFAAEKPVETKPVPPKMSVAKPGAVKPLGWLADRAKAARDGFTGHMDDVDEHFRLAWTTNCMRRGKLLGWENAHQGSWSAEGGAYWFDGLVKLAFQLDDPELKALAARRLDAVLDNVGANTVGFIWWYDRDKAADVEDAFTVGNWRFWTAGMSERVISAWWEATGDERAKRVLSNVFGYEEAVKRMTNRGPLLSGVADAARITRDPAVVKCLDVACGKIRENRFARPPHLDAIVTLCRHHGDAEDWPKELPSRHGVVSLESLLSVFRAYERTGDESLKEAVLAWCAFFDSYCRLPYGLSAMDEERGWAGAKRGTETCDVAADTFLRENLLASLGEGRWGDDVERAFFNAGPGCVSRDFLRHVYFQMPNRTGEKGEAAMLMFNDDGHTRYGRSVWPLCCTAALNRILPNYVQHMWLKTADGGVAVALYGPSAFEADLPAGYVAFVETTDYPFSETITIEVRAAPGVAFPIRLRYPGWCEEPSVAVNGVDVNAAPVDGFVTIERVWQVGDRVTLRFPMRPRIEDFCDMNDNGRLRRSVVLGPLLFAYNPPERDDNTPVDPIVEPLLPKDLGPDGIAVERTAMPPVWGWQPDAPVRLSLTAADGRPLALVPYGCTKLRISAFGIK